MGLGGRPRRGVLGALALLLVELRLLLEGLLRLERQLGVLVGVRPEARSDRVLLDVDEPVLLAPLGPRLVLAHLGHVPVELLHHPGGPGVERRRDLLLELLVSHGDAFFATTRPQGCLERVSARYYEISISADSQREGPRRS